MSGTQEKQKTQGKQQTTPHDTLVGRSLQQGTYQVEAAIGYGGMGQVFLASHRTLDVPVALKQGRADQPLPQSVIAELDRFLQQKQERQEQQASPVTPARQAFENDFPLSGGADTDRFLREALLLARLHHPAIPTLYDYFFENGYWYLVMEYLPGPTLAAYMRQYAPLPPLEALNYAMQLCDVLDYLHKQAPPVIYRDLKPANIILSPEGRLMLVDFGIARYFKEGQINDTTDFGSPGYASPEQYEGSGQTDGRSDLYSLGVILHEMLSGQRPARGGIRKGILESLRQINPALSPALSGLVTVATRPEAMYRFQLAQTFYAALERTRTIEERRTYQRYVLLVNETPRREDASTSIPAFANPPYTPYKQTSLADLRTKRVHIREHLHKARRERLEQEALAMQLASIDDSLKQRVVSTVFLTPTPGERESSLPRTKTPARLLQALFVVILLLSGVLTALFALNHYVHHNPTIVSSQKKVVTQPPTITAQSSWQALPSLSSPQADNTAVYAEVQGKAYIYVSGGYRGAGSRPLYSRGLYRYDIAAAHWELLTIKGFPTMGNNAATVDEQHHIFFTGGYSTDTHAVNSVLYRYAPENGIVVKIVPPVQAPIGFGNAMFADQQGHLYITEGFTTPGNPHARAGKGWYRYDIATGQWTILTPLPAGVGYVVLASDGQSGILMIGGSRDAGQRMPTSQIYRYDTVHNTWTPASISAPIAISGAASCLDGQGHVVIIGGYDPAHSSALASAWLVTLSTLNWQALPALPSGGSLLGAAACDGQKDVFLERGANNTSRPTADFLELTIQS